LSINPQFFFHILPPILSIKIYSALAGQKLSALAEHAVGGVLIRLRLKVQAISLMHKINYNRIFTMTMSLLRQENAVDMAFMKQLNRLHCKVQK